MLRPTDVNIVINIVNSDDPGVLGPFPIRRLTRPYKRLGNLLGLEEQFDQNPGYLLRVGE